ncbi:MAG: hypothetical protein DRJ47_00620 [Thermoprotei archaeon]|mgnify:CR=1 FL=1|nr:MAG: hypothetical protein DRJ47_00620 [Thermoprotei archaeon]
MNRFFRYLDEMKGNREVLRRFHLRFKLLHKRENTPLLESVLHDPDFMYVDFFRDRGRIYAFGEEEIHVWWRNGSNPWGPLRPLVENRFINEIWVRGGEVYVNVAGKGILKVVFHPSASPTLIEEVFHNISVEAAIRVDMRNPIGFGEYRGWRIQLKLPYVSDNAFEAVLTRIIQVPRLTAIVDNLLAARLLTLSLSSTVVIVGPAGSGKTTLLNSILSEILRGYKLKISVIEHVKELVLPETALLSRSIGEDVTDLIRKAIRYERPNILVLGEMAGEAVISWIEASKQGLPTLTTYHSQNIVKALCSMQDIMKAKTGISTPIIRYIDVFVVLRKTLKPRVIRRVDEVYVSDGQRLHPIYIEDIHCTEEKFLELIPRKCILGSTAKVYSEIKNKFMVSLNNHNIKNIDSVITLKKINLK